MAEALIRFEHVAKNFGSKQVIYDLSFTVQTGEFFVLVGASGSGKTTTLRMINQLLVPDGGNIYFKNRRIKDYNQRALRLQMGYVLQQIALFPNMTVAENIGLIPGLLKQNKQQVAQLTDEMLTDVDLDPENYRNRYPQALSGGEQQRVGILRAFASQPAIVLMDEPFSALDPISRSQLQTLVKKIHERTHSTIIFVTHDMDEALKLGDRIGVMRLGKLLQVGSPTEIMQHPANDFVQQLFANAVAKDAYQVTLTQLNLLGYLANTSTDQPTTSLTGQQTVADALVALNHQPAINVTLNGQPNKVLTKDRLFSFMSEYRQEGQKEGD